MSRMNRFDWLSRHPRRRSKSVSRYDRRLRVEVLEDRRMLAVFSVTNLSDGPVVMAGDLPGSLRQAIFDSNASGTDDTGPHLRDRTAASLARHRLAPERLDDIADAIRGLASPGR